MLITNTTLANRAGSELYVRDLALGLLERGHCPVAYSTRLGEVAEELRAATVPVIHCLEQLSEPPDIIHGQHHLETMTALLHFPGVPAVTCCHGWLPWEESPVISPRIQHYVAVDEVCRDRLVCEHGIAPAKVHVLLNFVDLKRFRPRPPLPAVPRRALVFSNQANEHTHLSVVRAACARLGLEVDVLGLASGRPCAHPEDVLPAYDLVFAKGRAALEALAVGTAVVLCDATGSGPLVTTRNYERLRALNCGVRTLREPLHSGVLVAQIAAYSSGDAAAVSARLRAEAGRDRVIDQLLAIYQAAQEAQRTLPNDPAAEQRAAAAYLRWLSDDRRKTYEFLDRARRNEALLMQRNTELTELREHYARLEMAWGKQSEELARQNGELAKQQTELAQRAAELVQQGQYALHLQILLAQQEAALVGLREQAGGVEATLASRVAELGALQCERDQLLAAWQAVSNSLTVRCRNRMARWAATRGIIQLVGAAARRWLPRG